jgi:hypothetical protein
MHGITFDSFLVTFKHDSLSQIPMRISKAGLIIPSFKEDWLQEVTLPGRGRPNIELKFVCSLYSLPTMADTALWSDV